MTQKYKTQNLSIFQRWLAKIYRYIATLMIKTSALSLSMMVAHKNQIRFQLTMSSKSQILPRLLINYGMSIVRVTLSLADISIDTEP